jgi:hypothetical protein
LLDVPLSAGVGLVAASSLTRSGCTLPPQATSVAMTHAANGAVLIVRYPPVRPSASLP